MPHAPSHNDQAQQSRVRGAGRRNRARSRAARRLRHRLRLPQRRVRHVQRQGARRHRRLRHVSGRDAARQRQGAGLRALLPGEAARATSSIECREISAVKDIQVRTLPCRVQKMDKLAPDVMRIQLKLPANERLQFLAGQYIDILHARRHAPQPLDGERAARRRAASSCTCATTAARSATTCSTR